jgi:hypothetical protein
VVPFGVEGYWSEILNPSPDYSCLASDPPPPEAVVEGEGKHDTKSMAPRPLLSLVSTSWAKYTLPCFGVASCQASILLSELPQFDHEQFLVSQGATGVGSDDEAGTRPVSDPSGESLIEELPVGQLLRAMGPTGTGTTSSPGAPSFSGMSCIMIAALIAIGAGDHVERITGELALLLPDAPATELFHPPRDCRS